MSDAAFDRREYPVRDDLAAAWLRGKVDAPRFAEGALCRVVASVLAIHAAPDAEAMRISETLFGERFTVYEWAAGWAWGQCMTDGYVGYVREAGLADAAGSTPTDRGPHHEPGHEPGHEVSALRSFAFAEADLKSRPLIMLHLSSRVTVHDERAGFMLTDAGGWVPSCHLAALGVVEADPVAVARRFLGTPYLWGGRSSLGLDCSALIQLAFARLGRATPRDSDQQERAATRSVEGGLAAAVAGDLLFTKGHVAMVSEPGHIIHANAHHMAVAEEPTRDFLTRLQAQGLALTSVRRF